MYLEQEEKKRKQREQDMNRSIVVVAYASMLYLRDKQGYGKKRLGDFIEGFAEILSDINYSYLDFEDIIHTIKEETGVEFTMEDLDEQK